MSFRGLNKAWRGTLNRSEKEKGVNKYFKHCEILFVFFFYSCPHLLHNVAIQGVSPIGQSNSAADCTLCATLIGTFRLFSFPKHQIPTFCHAQYLKEMHRVQFSICVRCTSLPYNFNTIFNAQSKVRSAYRGGWAGLSTKRLRFMSRLKPKVDSF